MRVLIVEDDRELAQSLKVALEESGMVTELAIIEDRKSVV